MNGGRIVLVVDDDRGLRSSLCDVLQEDGFVTAEAGNGQEALDWLRSHRRPALVLLDLNMPVMTGWEFRDRQLADEKLRDIPVVVISAMGSAHRAAVDAAAVLLKPVTLERLLEAVNRFALAA